MASKESSPARQGLRGIARPEPAPAGVALKWRVLLAVGVGTFLSALSGSVVNTVLPLINQAFGGNVATVQWVVTIYLLIVSGLLLSFGRLGDLRGHKPVYVAGFGIFSVASILCGLAPSAGWLIALRAGQALGAAMVMANSPAILTKNFPATERGRALGLQATMTYLGLTVGPSLGGWLAQQYTWQAVFYLSGIVGLLALLFSMRFIPHDAPAQVPERFDRVGAVTFMAGLVALLLVLNQGHAWGWTSAPALALLGLALILLAIFVVIETRIPNPMLDLSLFKNRLFSASTTSATINYIAIYGILYLMPFYLIQGRSFTASQAGLLLTAQPLIMAVAAPISGTLSDRIGSRLLSTLGMAILVVGLFLLSRLGTQSNTAQILLALAVSGLGTGIFISPNNNALMGSAPRHRQGIASGVLATARNVGMVLGVGLSGAILTTFLGTSQIGASSPALIGAISASFAVAAAIAVGGVLTSAVRGSRPAGL